MVSTSTAVGVSSQTESQRGGIEEARERRDRRRGVRQKERRNVKSGAPGNDLRISFN